MVTKVKRSSRDGLRLNPKVYYNGYSAATLLSIYEYIWRRFNDHLLAGEVELQANGRRKIQLLYRG